jgi:adenylate cyclase
VFVARPRGEAGQSLIAGSIELDPVRALLKVDGREVDLRNQSFEVLRILLENRGRLVTKEELLEQVWGPKAVTEDSLVQCLADIRRAIGDTGKTIVRTIPRRGYIFEGDLVAPESEKPVVGQRRLSMVVSVVGLVLVGLVAWQLLQSRGPSLDVERELSVAVLPFADMTASQDNRYLADGVSEEILNLLAQSRDLRVIARTSSFQLAESGADIDVIGKTLNVNYVLEGSVRQGNGSLRITAQLIDTRDSSPVWSDSYDRSLGDILKIQSDIARSVAAALHVALQASPGPIAPMSPQAHELIIQARSLLHLRHAAQNDAARELLARALAIEPDSIPARSQLARAVFQQPRRKGSSKHRDIWDRYNELADEAYEIDPNSSASNALKGWQAMHYYQDWQGAARYYERAMELDPTNLDTARIVVNALIILGDMEDAVSLGIYVANRDPLCITCFGSLSLAADHVGRFDLSENARLKVLELTPDAPMALGNLAYTKLRSGDNEGAIETLGGVIDKDAFDLAGMAIASYRLGRLEEYERWRQRLIDEFGEISPTAVAYVESVAGNADSAFDWLDRHLQQPAWYRGINYRSLFYENIHSDPRWHDYLERLGVSERQLREIDFDPMLPF